MRGAILVGVLILAIATAAAGEPATGSGLTPGGLADTHLIDERGMSLWRQTPRRSPTGLLYAYPWKPWDYRELDGGWLFRGFAEIGGIASPEDSDEAYFQEYVDLDDGVLVRNLVLDLRRPESGDYFEFDAGVVGRDDQFYRAELGRFGLFRLVGFFDGLRHQYANDARILHEGAGSDELRLPAPLVPGENSLADIETALLGVGESSIRVQRDSGGLRGEFELWRDLDLFASYSHTKHKGKRAGGGVIFPAFGELSENAGSLVETVEPVDWRTHDFSGGLRYGGQRIQANLVYTGQLFENRDDSLLWENPFFFFEPVLAGVPEGRSALAPDNQWHNIKGDVGVELPWRGRLTATVSWSRMEQDDDLLAPTVNAAHPNWVDATTALSRDSAEAKVDVLLADARLRLNPWRPLWLEGRFRYFDRNNRTDYAAFNPSNGLYGYVIEDGNESLGVPAGIQQRYAAIPFEYRRWNIDAIATWRPGRRTSATLAYEREVYERDNREVKTTRENRVRTSLSSSAFSWATLRVSYEYGDRQGSRYDRARNECFYHIGPDCDTDPLAPEGTPVRSLVQLRKFDQADRRQHLVNARLNFLISESLDLALAGGYRDDDFGGDYGRRFQRSGNANLELDFQPSAAFGLHAFGSFESGHHATQSIADNGHLNEDFNAGSLVFPFLNEWSTDSKRRTWGAGAGLRLAFWKRFDWRVDYSFFYSREELSYDFDPAGNALADVTAAEAGSHFPDLRYVDHLLQTSLRSQIVDGLWLRVSYAFRDSSIDNYQQTGLQPIVDGQQALYLGHVDRDFTTHVISATLQYQF